QGMREEEAKKQAPIMQEAQQMLLQWEASDAGVLNLWKEMNGWVYAGFEHTYNRLGVNFDKYYYESNTYLLGKDIIQEGLDKGLFFRKEDQSVWVDLTDERSEERRVG